MRFAAIFNLARLNWGLLFEHVRAYNLALPLQAVVEQLRAIQPSSFERRVYVWLAAKYWPAFKRFGVDLLDVLDGRGRLRYTGRSPFPLAAWMR